MRPILIILFFMLIIVSAKSYGQKWLPGHFIDAKGNKGLGLMRINPSPEGPVKGEAFIEFKEDKKAKPFELSASDLQSFVIGRDSFVVAHAPSGENWGNREVNFVKVVVDEDIKLYANYDVRTSGGGGFSAEPSIGIGIGTGFGSGGFGAGIGGGISIPLGGGGGRNYSNANAGFYYGENIAQLKRLTDQNFADVMTDIMGDEPDVVNKIAAKVYVLENIDQLIVYFKQVQASRAANPNQ